MRCRTYGVLCNFNFNVPDLQPLPERRVSQATVQRSGLSSPQIRISNAIWVDDGTTSFMLEPQDRELFNRFRHRTLITLGDSGMVEIYENYLLQVCFAVSLVGLEKVRQCHHSLVSISPGPNMTISTMFKVARSRGLGAAPQRPQRAVGD